MQTGRGVRATAPETPAAHDSGNAERQLLSIPSHGRAINVRVDKFRLDQVQGTTLKKADDTLFSPIMMCGSKFFGGIGALLLALCLDAGPEPADIVILQTTDIHAHVNPGWLQLATVIKHERRQHGADKVLLVDCGDTILGSPTAAVARGQTDVLMLNHLKYDAWIPGNHEVDAGIARLTAITKAIHVPILNGNFRLQSQDPFPAWKMFRKGGARIAVIGMNNPNLAHWLWGKRFAGYAVRPALPLIEKLIPEIQRQRPDLIILAIHQGFQERSGSLRGEVDTIARRFPQIHLILGGHTHRAIPGRRIGKAYYVQPGAHGEYLARIRVKLDRKRHRPLRIESSLIRTAEVKPDPTAKKLLQPWLVKAGRHNATVVTRSPTAVSGAGRPGRDCHLSEVICRAIAARAKAKVVFHPVFHRAGWQAGPITEADLFRAVPYENTVGVAWLTREDLAAIIKEQLRYWYAKDLANGIWGLTVRVRVKDQRVTELAFPQGQTRIPTAFNSYVIAGAGSRFPELRRRVRQPDARLKEIPVYTRDLLRDYLKSTPDWYAKPTCWIRYR